MKAYLRLAIVSSGCIACGMAETPATSVPVNGTFFTPVEKPTPLYFEPPAEAPFLKAPINTGLTVIASSEYHEFFINNGKLLGIGANRSGMLGLGHSETGAHPQAMQVKVPAELNFVAAAAGGYQSLAVDSEGYVWSFGNNLFGQRGDGTGPRPETPSDKPEPEWGTPVRLTKDAKDTNFGGPADPAVQVISTLWFNLARMKSGAVYFWGMNGTDGGGTDSRGMIGDGKPPSADQSIEARSVRRPTRVPFPEGVAVAHLAASASMAIAIDRNGGMWTWGGGNGWSFGAGDDLKNVSTPILLKQGRSAEKAPLGDLPKFVDATTRTVTNFAVDVNGDIWGWGMLAQGLCLSDPADWNPQGFPVKLTRSGNVHFAGIDALLAAGTRPVSVQASMNSTHVLFDDGSLWGWGDAAMGEVGDGHIVNYFRVTPKDGKSVVDCSWDWGTTRSVIKDATRILSGVRTFYTSQFSFHIMAIRKDGTIYSWGRNANGVLGNGLIGTPESAALLPYAPISEFYVPNLFDVPYPMMVQPF